MKKSILPLLFLSFTFSICKGNHANELFKQMMNVNSEWKNQADVASVLDGAAYNKTANFNDCIALHLSLVEKTLRARNVSYLNQEQQKNRLLLLNELHLYAKAGEFPINDYLLYKNPVFIDRNGTHCAVGYLMMQSGHDDLAQAINANEKFAYVHEIKTTGVKEWADQNGFTVNELAWIQPGYPPATNVMDMDSGLNGTVNAIAIDNTQQTVYVAGSFSGATTGAVCYNVAAWISGFAGFDWIPVGDGLNGTVHALLLHNDKLYAGGEFTMAGSLPVNHIAVYDIVSGQWQAMGSLDSTVYALAIYNNEIYAAGKFTGFLSKWSGSAWQDVAQGFLYGEGARTLEVFNSQLVIGGNFELATGAIRKHVAAFDGTYMTTLGMGTLTPVNDLVIHKGTLFAACDVVSGSDTCALASYEDGGWKIKLKGSNQIASYFAGISLNHLLSVNDGLIAAGSFECGSGMIYGNNLAQLSPALWGDTSQYDCIPLSATNDRVNTLAVSNSTLYFGGEFTMAGMNNSANHIANLQILSLGINSSKHEEISVSIFPNPVTDVVHVSANNGTLILEAEIADVLGKVLFADKMTSATKNISMASQPAGLYLLRVKTEAGWSNTRLIKQ